MLKSRRFRAFLVLILGLASPHMAEAQEKAETVEAGWLLPMPEVDADPAIPTLAQVVGHSWGVDVSSVSEIERYLVALSAAAPDRTKLVPYGRTIEKRPLAYLVISSPANLARLDDIRASNLRLRWATGRHNHYLFDMNRDWFLQTQSETRDKIAAYLTWQPHVLIDAHEMGTNNEYYFDPPADPILDLITPRQREWFERFGKRQAGRFDGFGFLYTSRELYDGFYPGYGTTWPALHGSIGILWEQ
ncbi:hypothetical protein HK102_011869, partial [Quaeritorhiza haematococci]